MGVLHGGLGLGQPVALEHDQLTEVVGKIPPRCRLEGGDLLARVTGASELGNLELIEQAEALDEREARETPVATG